MSTPDEGHATLTVPLARPELPMAVLVVFHDRTVQSVDLADPPADPAVVADCLVVAAFAIADVAPSEVPGPRRDEVYDVEQDGGV